MAIKVNSAVPIQERSGELVETPIKDCLRVASHWNRSEWVILHLADAMTITVAASDLVAAIKNAQNTSKF